MSEALDVSLRLVKAQAALVRRFDSRLGSLHGVSLADFMTLLHLGRAEGGRMRRVDLAQALGLTASGVTRGLVPLERIGLVVRETDSRDARVAYAALTDTGRERLGHCLKAAEQVAAEVFGAPDWSGDEVAALSGLLTRMGGTGLPEDHAAGV
ncbi:MarR family winged helix-turn-helix transcriptional regulator [Streptomyces sp. RerS4]|uniref:MarR family winged helix-turn-helix transcriptional regulator n=1 Tax=Streptomyces sp. RerS4 TaxID=2942449 RepID=UPI00201BCF73|nr:MarR family winged helix-turn-helix transcriptional regulator [Streptomyces sp. RerS4]UQW99562.1 MarR family winged helix-turn-helix transcriptional regulator [Streptomyces sp. RerS4]